MEIETALKVWRFFLMFFGVLFMFLGGAFLGQMLKTKDWSWFGPMVLFIILGVAAFVVSRGV